MILWRLLEEKYTPLTMLARCRSVRQFALEKAFSFGPEPGILIMLPFYLSESWTIMALLICSTSFTSNSAFLIK